MQKQPKSIQGFRIGGSLKLLPPALAGTVPRWPVRRDLPIKRPLCIRVCSQAKSIEEHTAASLTTLIPASLRKLLAIPPAPAGSMPRWPVSRQLSIKRIFRKQAGLQANLFRNLPADSQTPSMPKNPFQMLAPAFFSTRSALCPGSV